MEKLKNIKNKNLKGELDENRIADETGETLTGRGGTVSDSGSATSGKSTRLGPKLSKVQDKISKPCQERLTSPTLGTKKRKDASPLLGAGKSIAPDKRRKKASRRLQVTDRVMKLKWIRIRTLP